MSEKSAKEKGSWPDLGRFWTVPNMMSLFRLVLALPIAYLVLIDGSLLWIFGLFLLAVTTDYFDGRVARWSHTVSDWGKVLDPLADKIGGGLVILALALRGSLPAWFVALVLVRDALIVLGGVMLGRKTGFVVMSMWWGKIAVSAVAVTALAALLHADPPVLEFCVWTATALLVYSFLRYVVHYLRLRRAPKPQLDLYAAAARAAESAHEEEMDSVG